MRKYVIIVLALSVVMFFASCEIFQPNCDSQMENVRSSRGDPEEVNRYDSSDYHSVDWWYWSQGICYTFTWGSLVGSCEISTYTFDPFASMEERDNILKHHMGI